MCDAVMVDGRADSELTDDQIFIDDFLPRLTFSEEKPQKRSSGINLG